MVNLKTIGIKCDLIRALMEGKNVSSVKGVKAVRVPDAVGRSDLTAGKEYPVILNRFDNGFDQDATHGVIIDDKGSEILIRYSNCAHLAFHLGVVGRTFEEYPAWEIVETY